MEHVEDELITLNIGGTIFKTYRSKLIEYPHSKLGSLTTTSEHYLPSSKEYFFDRNPELFNVVLDYYRYDRQHLHIPNYTCGAVLLQEFDFWGLPLVNIADCCFHIYIKHEDSLEIQQNLVTYNSNTQIGNSLKRSKSFRKQLWLVLDQPNSSRITQICFAIFMIMVVLSVLMSCMVTDTKFRVEKPPPPHHSTNNRNQLTQTNSTTGNNTKSETFPDSFIGIWWSIITMTTVGYGDYVPKSSTGYFAGVITATSGVLIITMPIAIIAGKFDGYYTAYNTNKTKTMMRKLQKQAQKNSVAPLYNTMIINKH
ncbi:potassium voltage-gated channel protein Shaw-like [Mytilus edulis]|uniref:potassium voltage-gated channel protein Shaw-like n=1 Tax=Mytilus edulis TaxID=6550 RepID=UPI0039EFAD3A